MLLPPEAATAGRLDSIDELRLLVEDRKEHVSTVIRPSIEAGKVVIVDRYYFSTAAYQGARGLDPDAILRLNEDFAPPPDLLVLLDLDVDAADSCEPEYCSFRIQRQCDYPLLGALREPSPLSAAELNAIAADPNLSPEEKLQRFADALHRVS